jgi:hypothetical protein
MFEVWIYDCREILDRTFGYLWTDCFRFDGWMIVLDLVDDCFRFDG